MWSPVVVCMPIVRLALAAGAQLDARIVPFRGEYFHLSPAKRGLVAI